MRASLVNVLQLFEGKRQNIVPPFQREYVWDTSDWQRLWADLMACCNEQNPLGAKHFFGTIVIAPIKSMTNVEKYLIIDGQQRLITIALLLATLRTYVNYNEKRAITNYLDNSDFCTNVAKTDKFKLLPSLKDQKGLYTLIDCQYTQTEVHRMDGAVAFFQRFIRKGHSVVDLMSPGGLLDVIANCLNVVLITLSEYDDPYLVYESLNSNGQPLLDVDFIRNFVLSKFDEDPASELFREKIFQNAWSPLVNMLGKNLSEFFRQYMMLLEMREIPLNRVSMAFRKRFAGLSAPEMLSVLKDCLTYAGFFNRFVNPNPRIEVDRALREALASLKTLGASAAYPLLLLIFNARHQQQITQEDLINSLAIIESIIVRRKACGLTANVNMFREAAKNFSVTGQTATAYLSACLTRNKDGTFHFPDDQEFVDALVSSHPFDKEIAAFILEKIELMLGTKALMLHKNIQAEHIVAPSDSSFGQWMMRFGNLMIAESWTRAEGNEFSVRRELFKKSPFATNLAISEFAEWTGEEVRQRGQELAGLARKRWPYPAPADNQHRENEEL